MSTVSRRATKEAPEGSHPAGRFDSSTPVAPSEIEEAAAVFERYFKPLVKGCEPYIATEAALDIARLHRAAGKVLASPGNQHALLQLRTIHERMRP